MKCTRAASVPKYDITVGTLTKEIFYYTPESIKTEDYENIFNEVRFEKG